MQPSFTRGFRLHHNGHILDGAEFPSGRTFVIDDPEYGFATVATSMEHLLLGYHGARVEWPGDRAAILREAAVAIEAEQAREEATEWAQYGELDPETEVQGGAVRASAGLLRRLAGETADSEPEAGHTCDGCGHLEHRANKCPVTLYGESCACDEPIAAVARQDGEQP